jgi:probable phosphoglycerate mutase
MKFYFVRHGESEANTRHIISNRESPFGLTLKGRMQAEALAEHLKEIPVTAVFSSPILRARQTADLLSGAFGISCQVTEGLREYDCGILEEQSDQESWRAHRQYFEDWVLRRQYTSKPQDGECFLDIQNRFVPFIEELVRTRSEDDNILLIGHGGLFLLMLPLVLTNVDHSFAVSRGLGNTEYVLASREADGLVCIQWGEHILNASMPKTSIS